RCFLRQHDRNFDDGNRCKHFWFQLTALLVNRSIFKPFDKLSVSLMVVSQKISSSSFPKK
ncbi:MAG: hypothetical protein LH473_00795, partial [Chitinophagales bacterium]|nr:hypothetical protein [Chitinophagales bacterium]